VILDSFLLICYLGADLVLFTIPFDSRVVGVSLYLSVIPIVVIILATTISLDNSDPLIKNFVLTRLNCKVISLLLQHLSFVSPLLRTLFFLLIDLFYNFKEIFLMLDELGNEFQRGHSCVNTNE